MKTGPFIDRDHVQRIIREAKAQRAQELRDAAGWALGAARWGRLSSWLRSALPSAAATRSKAAQVRPAVAAH